MQQVQIHYPHNYHKTDKLGRPIYIERNGLLNIDNLFQHTSEGRMFQHYIMSYELLIKLRFPACSAEKGERIETGLNILDLKDGTTKLFNSRVRALVQTASKIAQDYYPEILGAMYIVNAPMLFTGIWAVVKGFLDEKTRKKIFIKGGKFESDLLELVAPENLPDFLGGTCTCKELGGCMQSEAGPWNQYEIVKPVGVMRTDGKQMEEEKNL